MAPSLYSSAYYTEYSRRPRYQDLNERGGGRREGGGRAEPSGGQTVSVPYSNSTCRGCCSPHVGNCHSIHYLAEGRNTADQYKVSLRERTAWRDPVQGSSTTTMA